MNEILLKNIKKPNSTDIDTYLKDGGYKSLEKALKECTPKDVIDIVQKSGLRGRGGAGFPAGKKWEFAAADKNTPRYLLCNADEGEPGTYKDRPIIEKDPHQLIEGIIISGYAIGAAACYIYIRGEYAYGADVLRKAIAQAYKKGFLGKKILGKKFDFDLYVHKGAGAYVCGEETALIESIEGKRGQSRIKPPFPVNVGVWNKPTVINNVETLANVSHIIKNGPDWFKSMGPEKCPGPKIYSISGHVNKPGNYELIMGTPLKDLIYKYGGGIKNGKKLKAIIPGGASTPVLKPEHIDVNMDYESVGAVGSMLGSGAVMVMDETVCMVGVARRLLKFFAHESCGKCSPCREGTHWLVQILDRIVNNEGKIEDIDLMLDICDNMRGKTFCPLGDGAINPVLSTIKHFRDEYLIHIEEKRCPVNYPHSEHCL
ncbi:MAG: NADH-quinone oxidoreductase subunit NuoF [Nitrospirota bacterium]